MAHDVFISHARKDRSIAAAICIKLESAQVRCWIAERDIAGGEDWTETTRNAIASSQVMVLVLSENANAAPHIEREIAHAFYTRRSILPVRLTETPPKRDFLFYLRNVRWFDAFTSPPEQHLEELAASINEIIHGHAVTRDIKLSRSMADEARKTLQYSDSRMGALRASHYGALEILKRITMAASLLAAIWLLWFVYSQTNHRTSLSKVDAHTMNSSVSTIPSPYPNVDQNALDTKEGSRARDETSVNSMQQHPGIADRTAPLTVKPSPAQIMKPATGDTKLGKLVETNRSQADVPPFSPPVAPSVESTPLEAQSGRSLKASSEKQSLKELVLEYLLTVATNDSSTQERLLAGRVNFFGKGVLSFSEIEAFMERYRQEWPIRKWEPKGEPEFPNTLHSSDPNLYEMLQPFEWTIANGSKHKHGRATLYVRIRKAANGAFHIFHLEQHQL
jgi:hypothetical protein